MRTRGIEPRTTAWKAAMMPLHHVRKKMTPTKNDTYMTTVAGFEPARAMHNRFQVCLLNHSDILSLFPPMITSERANRAQSGIEPETIRTQSEYHSTRPLSLMDLL